MIHMMVVSECDTSICREHVWLCMKTPVDPRFSRGYWPLLSSFWQQGAISLPGRSVPKAQHPVFGEEIAMKLNGNWDFLDHFRTFWIILVLKTISWMILHTIEDIHCMFFMVHKHIVWMIWFLQDETNEGGDLLLLISTAQTETVAFSTLW